MSFGRYPETGNTTFVVWGCVYDQRYIETVLKILKYQRARASRDNAAPYRSQDTYFTVITTTKYDSALWQHSTRIVVVVTRPHDDRAG
ncbi:unnamed protein product [Macrosiphum euphorbiae]|uniref:Uncharacterized protein n=1 Tax=Macrosiphum euphorbiae TaxID=13131 RepID=A0AAV0XKV0_9HEMI|nr:unnamed protein product [Macrosiphum euphorbiae]